MVWTTVDTEELRLSCDNHLTSLNSMGAFSQNWDMKLTFEGEIREIQVHLFVNMQVVAAVSTYCTCMYM